MGKNEKTGIKFLRNGKQAEDVSNAFPNFNILNKEERFAFFQALLTAKKNVEKKGFPTRECFGTVHDEYLEYFDRNYQYEEEKKGENQSVRSNLTFHDENTNSDQSVNESHSEEEQCPSSSRSSTSTILQQYGSIIQTSSDKLVNIFLKKKKNDEENSVGPQLNKEVQQNNLKFLRKSKTPKFDALNPEEKEIFFQTLQQARRNVTEKMQNKECYVMPLDTILKSNRNANEVTAVFASTQDSCKFRQREKDYKVSMRVTSTDNDGLIKSNQANTYEEDKLSQRDNKLEDSKSSEILDSLQLLKNIPIGEQIRENDKDGQLKEEKSECQTLKEEVSVNSVEKNPEVSELLISAKEKKSGENIKIQPILIVKRSEVCKKPKSRGGSSKKVTFIKNSKEKLKVLKEDKSNRKESQEEVSPGKREHNTMIVDDAVIEKIKKLIWHLEAKVKKNRSLEEEYLNLLVDYADYLSKVLESLIVKKDTEVKIHLYIQPSSLTIDQNIPMRQINTPIYTPEKTCDVETKFSLLSVGCEQDLKGKHWCTSDPKTQKELEKEFNSNLPILSDSDTTGVSEETSSSVHSGDVLNDIIMPTNILQPQNLQQQKSEIAEGISDKEKEVISQDKPPIVTEKNTTERHFKKKKIVKFLMWCIKFKKTKKPLDKEILEKHRKKTKWTFRLAKRHS